MYTLPPSFAEIYLKITKFCCFNRDNSPFLKIPSIAFLETVKALQMLLSDHHWQPKLKTTDELKVALLTTTTWEELPKEHINKAVAFNKHLTACEAANGGKFKHMQ